MTSIIFKIPTRIDIQTLRRDKVFADNLSDLFLKLFDINDEEEYLRLSLEVQGGK